MIRDVIEVENVVARAGGIESSPRAYILNLPTTTPEISPSVVCFWDGRSRELLSPYIKSELTGFVPRESGRFNALGLTQDPKLFQQNLGESIRVNLFQARRPEFRSALIEGLIGFVRGQGVIYDSVTYEFTDKWSSGGDTVSLVGYIEDIPSFMLVAGMWDSGLLANLRLYPGVLVDRRYPVNTTPSQALAIAKTREPEEYPLNWDNVVLEYTYTDLREPGSTREAAFDTPYGRREAYPHILVRACRETPQGRQFQESYFIDAVQGKIVSVIPPVLYMGDASDEKPNVITVRDQDLFQQGIRCTPPESTRFKEQDKFDLCGFGTQRGAWSTCGQYAKFDFGVYKVTLCPAPQS